MGLAADLRSEVDHAAAGPRFAGKTVSIGYGCVPWYPYSPLWGAVASSIACRTRYTLLLLKHSFATPVMCLGRSGGRCLVLTSGRGEFKARLTHLVLPPDSAHVRMDLTLCADYFGIILVDLEIKAAWLITMFIKCVLLQQQVLNWSKLYCQLTYSLARLNYLDPVSGGLLGILKKYFIQFRLLQ